MSQEEEVRRLQRLREEQLRSRDPSAKERAKHQQLSKKFRRRQQKITVWSIIQDLPAKWLLMFIGILIGTLLALILNMMFPAPWAKWVGFGIIFFGLVAGRVMGAIRDWGDEDWGRKY